MDVTFINFNEDVRLDPEIKTVPLSRDAKSQTPAFCLPWVEAYRYSIQLKANHDYWIRKDSDGIHAVAVENGSPLPSAELFADVPEGIGYLSRGPYEEKNRKLSLGTTPSFSSPWQEKNAHSITLKLGISWWTPPGWGLFFCSPVHGGESFRVVEGYVRTDEWHRDIPILIQPMMEEIRIPKYSVVASALLLPAEDLQLIPAKDCEQKVGELALQTSLKRMSPSIYKGMLLGGRKKDGK